MGQTGAKRPLQIDEVTADRAGEIVRVAGWVQDVRDLGGIAFVLLRDRFGLLQITAVKKRAPELYAACTKLMRESVIEVEGTVVASEEAKRGVEVHPARITVLGAAEAPLPLGVVDRVSADLDTRLNNRFLDLRKEHVRAIFEVKSHILQAIRAYLVELGFIEVVTPKIVAAGAEGGATLFPLTYFDRQAYLAQSPQLYKQNLMGAGFDRLFEIGPAYRAEASDTVRHIAEFLSLDVELSFIESSEDVMAVAEGIARAALDSVKRNCASQLALLGAPVPVPELPVPRVPYAEAIELLQGDGLRIRDGDDLGTEGEKRLGEIMRRDRGAELYFITEFPTSLKRATFYAMRNDAHPELTGYFDLDYRGQEIVSGGQREHRYPILVRQMEENGLPLESFEFYLRGFRYGMPPHGGFGFGIERFLQKMLNLSNIRETVLYPRDRARLAP